MNNPSQQDKISKAEKLKESNKLTKKKRSLLKPFEAFNMKAIYDSFQNTH